MTRGFVAQVSRPVRAVAAQVWRPVPQAGTWLEERPVMDSANASRVGVIGGGLGGLAAACVLAARGYRVVLFEKSAWLGGKAAALNEAGFRFDMGPTILTVPSVLRRIFAEAGRDLDEYLDLVRLDPQWRCFFADGGVL